MVMKKRLLILGASGHARVVAETALLSGITNDLAFIDDANKSVDKWPLIGNLEFALEASTKKEFQNAFVAIGNSKVRAKWLHKLMETGYNLPPIIHPHSWISPSSTIGNGTAVLANAIIQANVVIGKGCILNTSSSVDHDCVIGNYVHISPGAHLAGNVTIGNESQIGIGASIIQNTRIGIGVTVGAGAAVIRELPDGVTAVGVPAKVIKDNC